MRKILVAALLAGGLAGCAINPNDPKVTSGYVSQEATAQTPQGDKVARIDTWFVEANFPSGQTGDVMKVRFTDPVTGKVDNAIYSFNGETEGRTYSRAFVGSVLPAAIGAGGTVGAALMIRPSNFVLNGGNAYSSSKANASAGAGLTLY